MRQYSTVAQPRARTTKATAVKSSSLQSQQLIHANGGQPPREHDDQFPASEARHKGGE